MFYCSHIESDCTPSQEQQCIANPGFEVCPKGLHRKPKTAAGTPSILKRLVMFFAGLLRWYVWHWKCAYFDHLWIEDGGRRCPKDQDIGVAECYQPVYICARCNEQDYGDEGGPAWKECEENCSET